MSSTPAPLSVVIPAYNEENRLPRTLERMLAWRPARFSPVEILVVDDGSTDSTAAVVRGFMKRDARLGLVQVAHGGVMHAVISGYKAAAHPFVGNMDADDATDPAEFEKFAAELETADVVTGSRQLRGGLPPVEGKPFFRRVLSKGFSTLFRVLFLCPVRDPQIGCRLFKREALLRVLPLVTSKHDGIKLAEIMVKAHGLGCAIKEVPVAYRHDDDSRLVSRRPYRIVAQVFAALLGMWMDAHAQFKSGALKRRPVRFGALAGVLDRVCGRRLRELSC